MSSMLSKEAEQVLKEIINNQENGAYWQRRFSKISGMEETILRGCFKELSEGGFIKTQWADNIPYYINVLKAGYMYDEYSNPNRKKLASMLEEAKDIKTPINATYSGGPNITTYNSPAAVWVNDASTFVERHLREHPLYHSIHSSLFHKKVFAFNELQNSLKSILNDDEYWENTAQSPKNDEKIGICRRNDYDVFISHANADKMDLIDDLYTSLLKLGIRIFYDKETLEWGDDWKVKILEGTEKSEFAIIVISDKFFGREWTERELSEFLSRQNANGQKLILPILKNITPEQLQEKYPSVSNIQAIESSKYTTDEIALLFAKQLIQRLKM